MSKEIVARVSHLSASYGASEVLNDISFEIGAEDCLAIVGPMGSGKTTLAKALSGRLFRKGDVWFQGSFVLFVEQQHHFKNRSNISEFYLQQRFNSSDSEDSYTVREELGDLDVGEWIKVFGIETLLDKPLLQLSNGENKRLQIVKSLGQKPDWLLLDNPYLGLDVAGRAILSAGLRQLHNQGIRFILFLSGGDVPEFVNQVYTLRRDVPEIPRLKSGVIQDACNPMLQHGEENKNHMPQLGEENKNHMLQPGEENKNNMLQPGEENNNPWLQPGEENNNPWLQPGDLGDSSIVSLRNVTIRYGTKTILDQFSWTINRGERWVLKGPNGAGKSTLLSLITADNPQSYSQDITLFGRKRGTGESIWDIKRNIGYVSPEMHLYFKETGTCFAVIASGLFDLLGVTRKVNEVQTAKVSETLDLFGLGYLAERSFHTLSTGEQKMILIARAFVKNPPLLILDEPCQGLDQEQVNLLKRVIDELAARTDMTLIFVSHYAEDVPSCVNNEMLL
ncbi:ATP-binding cassette domain-containing protein [Aquirufa regiilacus]|uniref:ATP-binding cassette domain-containing protein n=1 Tax=Aquirufa regiilacus TaxID=3024868 RepID=A0ABU3TRL0_9BACT|nr:MULTISPECIES: ATP-binding cassette domain-containing protein [unclassified Aquirufa]MDT8888160.1 ATP-binding cassette domain-containing protein [Aquirufa sp. LEPPI-3A]MDU0808498.1 ATP-binding cassette domain-containing protein [Aquirufa sp. LEOWEIH-7C]